MNGTSPPQPKRPVSLLPMDCETNEPLLLDRLYGELDEVASAAVDRHVSGCARCAAIWGELSSTRRAVALPLLEAPPGLEERIVSAAHRAAAANTPSARILSIAGRWAMRPQTAMAAVFLLMVGTSAFLVRTRASGPRASDVSVTVNGTPAISSPAEPQQEKALDLRLSEGAHGATPSAPPPPAASFAPPSATMAMAPAPGPTALAPDEGIGGHAGRAMKSTGSGDAPGNDQALLAAAEALRQRQGCEAALSKFNAIAERSPGTWVGNEAALRAARCLAQLGRTKEAREGMVNLASTDTH